MAVARKPVLESGSALLVVGVMAFVVYVWTSAPGLAWLDSPELAATSAELGVAHSPGHPLTTFVNHFATWLPVGSLAWRINLASALFAALAIVALGAACAQVLATTSSSLSRRWRGVLAASAATIAALGPALWSNAVRAEVYALQALLLWAALWLWMRVSRVGDRRIWIGLAILLGLAAVNHYVMAAPLGLIVVLWGLVASPKRRVRTWLLFLAVSAVAAIVPVLYLVVRASAHPIGNWGVPNTWSRLVWTLSGRAFAGNVGGDHASGWVEDVVQATFAVVQSVSIPLVLLATFALLSPLLKRSNPLTDNARLWWAMATTAALAVAARALLGYDPGTPDHDAYLLLAVGVGVVLACATLGALCQSAIDYGHSTMRVALGAWLPLVVVAAALFGLRVSEQSRRDQWAADDMARWELDDLPVRALVLVSYYQTSFRQQAMTVLEGARPDIEWLDRSFLTYPGHARETVRRYPHWAELVEAPLAAGYPTPLVAIDAIAATRPVFLQLHLNVDAAAKTKVWSAGAFAAWGNRVDKHRLFAVDAAARARLQQRLLPGSSDQGVSAALLWHDVMRLDHLCARGERAAAQRVYDGAYPLAPDDLTLEELREGCGLVSR